MAATLQGNIENNFDEDIFESIHVGPRRSATKTR